MPVEDRFGPAARLYCLWAVLAIGVSIARAGLTAESVTRLLVVGLLLLQLAAHPMLVRALPWCTPKWRFVLIGMLLAAVVEGFHMISMPVFGSLRIGQETGIAGGLRNYALDLAFTLPAYLAIFSTIWFFVNRYRYGLWDYIVTAGFAQAIGDGGLFYFWNAPGMLLFLPYPMSNYHAINVLPLLSVREYLPADTRRVASRYLIVPAVIAAYLACGAMIRLVGRRFGFEAG